MIERNCTIVLNGQTFESDGAVVTPERITAYPQANGVLGDWHGNAIGTWRIVSTWKTPRSYVSTTMHQIEARVAGVTYTGRGAGINMAYTGKRKAK